jgi:hypothetical protein
MKFNEDIVVYSKTMNGNKIFSGMRDMKNIFKMQGYRGGFNNCMTNMTNAHTLSIGRVNLFTALVLLSHGELVELTGDVVDGVGVAILVGVHAIGHDVGTLFFLLLFFIIVGVAMPTLPGFMAWLATNLACDKVAVIAASAASTACIAATTASTTSTVATAASSVSSMMATST